MNLRSQAQRHQDGQMVGVCVGTCAERLKDLGLLSPEKKNFRGLNNRLQEMSDTTQVYGRRMRNGAHKLRFQ